jgi:hypothetical protein
MKKIQLVNNGIGGFDPILERDAGNEVRILTGNESLLFWKHMLATAEIAIEEIEKNKKSGNYKGK